MRDKMADGRLVVCLLLMGLANCFAQRKLTTTFLNPPSSECNNPDLTCAGIGYIKAVGDNDTLHYLVTGFGLPTVMVVYTNTVDKPELMVDWEKLLSGNDTETAGSIHFKNPKVSITYSYGVMFSRLIEYNDTKDKADLTAYNNDNTEWNTYDFRNFTWENITQMSVNESNAVLLKAHKMGDLFQSNGSLTLKFSAFEHSDRDDKLPHLQYNDNVTLVDLTLSNLWTNFNDARFAIEMVLVGGDKSTMKLQDTRSIDDEYTPGVFKIFNLLTRPQDENDGGFLQWKPVCYLKPARARSVATFVKHYGFNKIERKSQHEAWLNESIVYGFYGNSLLENARTVSNLSFGLAKDGFYTGTNYTAWTVSVGYGKPPEDAVSTLVIVVISVGLGLPALIMIFGGIYVCVKKKKPEDKMLNSISRDYQPIPS